MLVIRMQRTGRKGHAQFRVVVQDSRRTPTSGKVVASLGHFNPHTKETSLDKEKTTFYLEHGAQPSERVVRLLTQEGVKMPAWVNVSSDKSSAIRHADKLRKNRPAEEAAPAAETESIETATEPEKPTLEVIAESDAAVEVEATTESSKSDSTETESPAEASVSTPETSETTEESAK